MAVLMVGVDHNKADLDVRSVFSFTSKRMGKAYEAFMAMEDIEGCVIISTCNRMEFWLSVKGKKDISAVDLLCDHIEVSAKKYSEYFTERSGREAVDHLFRLSAGLESKIVGEDQIITQVGDALAFARSCYATDNTLEVLFRQAITAGKRVRTETVFSIADRSVIHTALRMLKEDVGITVENKKCMVIGNGMMGKLSAQTLMDNGADVTVTVRKYHSGVVDIPFGCKRIIYDERYDLLPSCDIVVSATSSPNYTITPERLSGLEVDHTIPMIDLAVPRDIAPEVRDFSWVSLYDIDSFKIDVRNDEFLRNLKKAEAILDEEKENFYVWYEGRDIVPVIQSIKERAGEDVLARMSPFFKHTSLEDEEKDGLCREVTGASERMMNHLLYDLRAKMSEGSFRDLLQAMSDIYE